MESVTIIKLVVILLVIYATSLHEMAHAYVATWRGDPTPGRYGRLTFNPIPHLDPLITAVILPIVMYMSGGMLFCMAQTPIDPSRFRRPLRDHALVAVAGPIMNFLFALLLIGLLWLQEYVNPALNDPFNPSWNTAIFYHAARWNIVIGVFNLMPMPPLDGYWICRGLLPLQTRRSIDSFARSSYALIICLLLGSFLYGTFLHDTVEQYYHVLLPF